MNMISELRARARQEAGKDPRGNASTFADPSPADLSPADLSPVSRQFDDPILEFRDHPVADHGAKGEPENADTQPAQEAGETSTASASHRDEPHKGVRDRLAQTHRDGRNTAKKKERTRAGPQKSRSGRLRIASPFSVDVIRHRSFPLILTIWGGAICGLSVMMLSGVTIARLSMFAGTGALGDAARLMFAAIAAIPGALGGFVLASMARAILRLRSRHNPYILSEAGRRVRPIDPTKDLGSESLDAPLDTIPFAAEIPEPAQATDNSDRPVSTSVEGPEAQSDPGDEPLGPGGLQEIGPDAALDESGAEEPQPAKMAEEEGEATPETARDDESAALDLSDFGEVIDEEAGPAATPCDIADAEAEAEARAALTGIDKLRASPAHELSLVQLVERFAAALHEAQAGSAVAGSAALMPGQDPQRERDLSEALKALSRFSKGGYSLEEAGSTAPESEISSGSSGTEHDLREALTRLQSLRGAA